MKKIAAVMAYLSLCCFLAAQIWNQSSSQQSSAPPLPLSLTVASQDRALFVSWYSDDPKSDSKLEYVAEGKDSNGHIVSRRCPNHGGCLLAPLENDILWDVSLRGVIDGMPLRIGYSGGTPRARDRYAYLGYASWLLPNFNIFTSWDAADSWLRANGIQSGDLRYRGQKVSDWGQDIPNGFYTYGESPKYAFALARDIDSQFNGNQSLRDLAEVRRVFRRILWQTDASSLGVAAPYVEYEKNVQYNLIKDSPLTQNCHVTKAKLRRSVDGTQSTIAHFVQCARTQKRGLAVYLEGHEGSGLELGIAMWASLADVGWDILLIDMPMHGFNSRDAFPSYHFSYAMNDIGGKLPIGQFLSPIKWGIDWTLSKSSFPPRRLITIGRSGGGWSSILYSCFDERVEYAVAIAGLIPMSSRLENNAPFNVGDYEQFEPALYSHVPYEQLMLAAGSKGAFYIYNENDPCCFQVHSGNPFLAFLQDSALTFNRELGFYIDPANVNHSASPEALEAMRVFIKDLP